MVTPHTTGGHRTRTHLRRRGGTLVYVTVATTTFFGIASLAFDYGHVSGARAELQAAIDNAARYGATGLADGTAVAKAIAAAQDNTVDGVPLVLTSSQVTTGRYDSASRVFTAGASSPNAIRVSVDAVHPRYVSLTFASVVGFPQFALRGESYAMAAGGTATTITGAVTGFVGIDYFNFNGPLSVRAWDSGTGQALDPNSAWAAGQTKGPANLNSGVTIFGELDTSGGVSMNNATITKGIQPLPSGWGTYAAPVAPNNATYLGNYNGPSGSSQTFAAGSYRFDTFNVPSGKSVTFAGPSSVYVNGSMSLAGGVVTAGNVPNNLNLYTTTSSGVDIGTNTASPLYANIYAPNSPMNLNGRTFYGSIIAKGINVNQPFNMYIDARATNSTSTTTSTGTMIVGVRPTAVH